MHNGPAHSRRAAVKRCTQRFTDAWLLGRVETVEKPHLKTFSHLHHFQSIQSTINCQLIYLKQNFTWFTLFMPVYLSKWPFILRFMRNCLTKRELPDMTYFFNVMNKAIKYPLDIHFLL